MMMAATMSTGFPARPRSGGSGTPPLESAVLERCRQQDPMAFRAFVVRHERMVFALLSRMLKSGPEVEDLAQETFVRAFRAFPSFDPNGPAKASTWLLTIAVRLALDLLKKRKLTVVEVDENIAAANTPEVTLEQRQLGDALSAAAASLPDDQRAVLVLSDVHGLSQSEIAGALEIPENTVKTRLFRAREKMRAAMSEWRPS
jgi:RNA polymerase sigma-70 factor (ECF subfamily)